MVVWVFAGGGEAEVAGLIPFLEKNFNCTFERKTPVRQKPGPKPNQVGYGHTGRSLRQQITRHLQNALQSQQSCDLILVLDDLDCRDVVNEKQSFENIINSLPQAQHLPRCIAFASPELESWLIADWDNTFARHIDFRANHQAMRHQLSSQYHIPFNTPESFSQYDPVRDTCVEKLSEALVNSTEYYGLRYSKATHTPLLLKEVNPITVSQKCPLFRQLYTYLNNFC